SLRFASQAFFISVREEIRRGAAGEILVCFAPCSQARNFIRIPRGPCDAAGLLRCVGYSHTGRKSFTHPEFRAL
ncbi:hypothetical protein, partial [Turicimonas muris]|uniref:hypothetical protein n=1 Tax=Turicimonas muris TaxID=1796652 RepID=UPI00263BDE65